MKTATKSKRVTFKPRFEVTVSMGGDDTSNPLEYEWNYDGATGILTIGCQERTLADWHEDGDDVIDNYFAAGCDEGSCSICDDTRGKARLARKLLTRLLDAIDAAEKQAKTLRRGRKAGAA